jgi:hypothetical protein
VNDKCLGRETVFFFSHHIKISASYLSQSSLKKKKKVTRCLILLLSLCQVCLVSSKGRTNTRAVDNDDVITLIVGGTDAGVGVHTHQVPFFRNDGKFWCGGILVAHDVVVLQRIA